MMSFLTSGFVSTPGRIGCPRISLIHATTNSAVTPYPIEVQRVARVCMTTTPPTSTSSPSSSSSISATSTSSPPSCMGRRAFLWMVPAAALMLTPTVSFADHTAVSARRSFDRYHPRILNAIDTIRDIGNAVAKGDKDSAAALVNDKVFAIKARRAFSIYATSFSDNYLGKLSRQLLKYVDTMYSELDLVAKGSDMSDHFQTAIEKLEAYYTAARLPLDELSGLRTD